MVHMDVKGLIVQWILVSCITVPIYCNGWTDVSGSIHNPALIPSHE